MTWALLTFSIILMTVLVIALICLSVLVSRSSVNALATLVSFDQRAQNERASHRAQIQSLVDRVLSGNWEAVRQYEIAEDAGDGGFFAPEEQVDPEAVTEVLYRDRWGRSQPVPSPHNPQADVEALAEIDDLDGLTAERGTQP